MPTGPWSEQPKAARAKSPSRLTQAVARPALRGLFKSVLIVEPKFDHHIGGIVGEEVVVQGAFQAHRPLVRLHPDLAEEAVVAETDRVLGGDNRAAEVYGLEPASQAGVEDPVMPHAHGRGDAQLRAVPEKAADGFGQVGEARHV